MITEDLVWLIIEKEGWVGTDCLKKDNTIKVSLDDDEEYFGEYVQGTDGTFIFNEYQIKQP
jgi:hypothetical protein